MGIFGSRKEEGATLRDPVCGMAIVKEHALGPEESAAGKVWFCSVGCQATYQSQQGDKGKEAQGVEA